MDLQSVCCAPVSGIVFKIRLLAFCQLLWLCVHCVVFKVRDVTHMKFLDDVFGSCELQALLNRYDIKVLRSPY